MRRHPVLILILSYVGASLLASYIFYLRLPQGIDQANFYAEDSLYVMNILEKSFLASVFTPFNGYLIVGTYLVQGVGFSINHLIFGGRVLYLPESIAIASYAFLGFSACLPMVLLRNILAKLAILGLILATIFVPLPSMDYGIIGSTANLKFLFAYIAVLLIIYRHFLPLKSKKHYVIDSLLLICALTNILCIFLLPVIIVRHIRFENGHRIFRAIRTESFISLSILAILLIASILFLTLTSEIKPIGGIYDKPYQWSETIEIFVTRSYLFSYVYGIYGYLNNIISLIFMAFFIYVGFRITEDRLRTPVFMLFVSVLIISAFTLVNRPGLSTLFGSYSSSGYDQYFYTQNIIALLIGSIIISGLLRKWPNYSLYIATVMPIVAVSQYGLIDSVGRSNFMAESRGTFISNARKVCADSPNGKIYVPTYPQPPFVIYLESTKICPDAVKSKDNTRLFSLGLQPSSDKIIFKPGTSDIFPRPLLLDNPI